jgi:hypothetical protein
MNGYLRGICHSEAIDEEGLEPCLDQMEYVFEGVGHQKVEGQERQEERENEPEELYR